MKTLLLSLALLALPIFAGQDALPTQEVAPKLAGYDGRVDADHPWGPYEDPTEALICHIDKNTYRPVMDGDKPRCFLVPAVVSGATLRFMLSQTAGMENGYVKYLYASWWDFMVKHHIKTVAFPHLEQFPPPELEQAKAQAKTALEAVDATKEAIIHGAVASTTATVTTKQ